MSKRDDFDKDVKPHVLTVLGECQRLGLSVVMCFELDRDETGAEMNTSVILQPGPHSDKLEVAALLLSNDSIVKKMSMSPVDMEGDPFAFEPQRKTALN